MSEEKNRESLREQRRHRRRMQWEHHMQRRENHCQNMHHDLQHSNKGWMGILIILIGVVWLLKSTGVYMPEWLFTWPVLLIAIGIFFGIASRFRNPGFIIFLLIGTVFLVRNFISPEIDIEKFIWPVVFICLGLLFLIKRRHIERRRKWVIQNHPEWKALHDRWHQHDMPLGPKNPFDAMHQQTPYSPQEDIKDAPLSDAAEAKPGEQSKKNQDNADWLDVTTVFGGARRHVISKNFKGGDLVNVCGGTELDLTHADIQGVATIDIVALWGGIRIAVPPNWQVRLNVTHLMAGTDVRRGDSVQVPDPNKVLVLTGTVLMAGIEIRDIL